MKKLVFIIVLAFLSELSNAQFYVRSNKSIGASFGVNPISSLHHKKEGLKVNYSSASFSMIKKIYSGIYPMLSYRYYTQHPILEANRTPFQSAHEIGASVLVDIRLTKMSAHRLGGGGCFYHAFGLVLIPEYNYGFLKDVKDRSTGEAALRAGLSFYNHWNTGSKRRKEWSYHWDIYYRKGFTPYFINHSGSKYFRNELGLQLRILKHEVYNFLD